MNFAALLNRFFGITNKKVDYFAVIFAAVLLASGKKLDDELKEQIKEDAKRLFRSRSHQEIFTLQVAYFFQGGSRGNKDLNFLVKQINRNSKIYKVYNPRIPYHLLGKYKNEAIEQQRLFEYLNTIKPEYDKTDEQKI